jgi:hypothetical protein
VTPASGNDVPLVFVYKGSSLPDYAYSSIRLAKKAWSGRVVVLHSFPQPLEVSGVDCENFEDWYNPDEFGKFARLSNLDKDFRDGFWLHAVERFFILEQWSKHHGEAAFAHAELDAFFFTNVQICARLDTVGTGLFYPFGSHEHAGAVFLYVNEVAALSRLNSFLVSDAGIGDEMRGLWFFAAFSPRDVFALPSHTFFEARNQDLSHLQRVDPGVTGGLFDVQPFGTWILGQDARNTPRAPQVNRFFFDGIGSLILEKLVFRASPWRKGLSVGLGKRSRIPVLLLHVHSKNFSKVSNTVRFWLHVVATRLPVQVPVSLHKMDIWLGSFAKFCVDAVYVRLSAIRIRRES